MYFNNYSVRGSLYGGYPEDSATLCSLLFFYRHRIWDLVWFEGSTSVILLVSKADLNLGFWFIILPHVSRVQNKVCGFPSVPIALQVWALGKAVFLLSETTWVWTREVNAVIRPHWSLDLGEEKERSRLSTPILLAMCSIQNIFYLPILCFVQVNLAVSKNSSAVAFT